MLFGAFTQSRDLATHFTQEPQNETIRLLRHYRSSAPAFSPQITPGNTANHVISASRSPEFSPVPKTNRRKSLPVSSARTAHIILPAAFRCAAIALATLRGSPNARAGSREFVAAAPGP